MNITMNFTPEFEATLEPGVLEAGQAWLKTVESRMNDRSDAIVRAAIEREADFNVYGSTRATQMLDLIKSDRRIEESSWSLRGSMGELPSSPSSTKRVANE